MIRNLNQGIASSLLPSLNVLTVNTTKINTQPLPIFEYYYTFKEPYIIDEYVNKTTITVVELTGVNGSLLIETNSTKDFLYEIYTLSDYDTQEQITWNGIYKDKSSFVTTTSVHKFGQISGTEQFKKTTKITIQYNDDLSRVIYINK